MAKKLQCKHVRKTHGCQFYCAKNHGRSSARDPLRYIFGSKAKVRGMVMSSFLQSAFYPGPRGNSSTKNIASSLPVKTTDQGFCHNITGEHSYVCLLTQKCMVSIKISNKWSRGQGWQTQDGFEAICGFALVKFRGQKIHEGAPMMKYLVSLWRKNLGVDSTQFIMKTRTWSRRLRKDQTQ